MDGPRNSVNMPIVEDLSRQSVSGQNVKFNEHPLLRRGEQTCNMTQMAFVPYSLNAITVKMKEQICLTLYCTMSIKPAARKTVYKNSFNEKTSSSQQI